MWWLAFSAYIE